MFYPFIAMLLWYSGLQASICPVLTNGASQIPALKETLVLAITALPPCGKMVLFIVLHGRKSYLNSCIYSIDFIQKSHGLIYLILIRTVNLEISQINDMLAV